jgi:predicted ATP-dependent Lon-type protease
MSSGHTTVSNMFYNMASHRVGLVGNWDCVAFDEVAGITQTSGDMVQIMKNYMANGSFARGSDSISSDASIAFEGNTVAGTGGICLHIHPPSYGVPNGKTACLLNMYTLPEFRGKGVAGKILSLLI